MLPAVELTVTNLGALAFSNSGKVAWKSVRGPKTLISKCSRRSAGLASATLGQFFEMPALAMTMSMLVMEWVAKRVWMAAAASASMALSNLRVIRVLEGPLGSVESARAVRCCGSRTAAITVCEGLRMYFLSRPRPIPVAGCERIWSEFYQKAVPRLAPVINMVVLDDDIIRDEI